MLCCFIIPRVRSVINYSGILTVIRHQGTVKIMKVLNVAEKNDAAKNIANFLSRNTSRRRDGLSPYNKIYEFDVRLWGQNCQMLMTSVSGHLLGYEFTGMHRKWQSCHPLSLFDAPVVKQCSEDNYIKIKKTLEREVRSCDSLIIWTDCDREGENIGFEIIEVCSTIKPSLRIYRAKFSEITHSSVHKALETLGTPNKAVSDAVDVRSELDLRIGAAFTRFQTLRLQKVFPRNLADMLISYGSCQFPTLGFVVERYLAIERFKSEPYWKIKVMDTHDEISVEFRWGRVRLFEKMPCQILLDACLEQPQATVQDVTIKPKSKWRPLPLDTIELEKQGSRKLRLNAKETMRIAEKLYTQGLISYPRTETNIFPEGLNLQPLVAQQVNNQNWGEFAQRLLADGLMPRQGKKSDQAHPPIHPTKYIDNLQGNEAKVYEFVVRHFLACLSKNAEGQETIVNINIADEKFTANGLRITAKNYLDVYIYDKWSDKQVHTYQQGQVFQPTSIDMINEETSPPKLLTEADLIALMDKNGIGTDATHAEHIDTIKSRQYVGLVDKQHFMPGKLGIGLVMGYDNMGFEMSKPNLRADLEKDLKLICDGQKNPKDVLQNQITKYREVFKIAIEKAHIIDNALANYLEEQPQEIAQMQINVPEQKSVLKCPKCGSDMILRSRKQGSGKYIGCVGYPACNNAIWFPELVEDITVLDDICNACTGNMHKLKFKLMRNAFPLLGTSHITCIGGCDPNFNEMLGLRDSSVRQVSQIADSGYSTTNATRSTRDRNISLTTTSRTVLVSNNSTMTTNSTVDDRNSTWGNINSDSIIMCHCHENAVQLTVRKEGPNQGRLFYKCGKPQGSGCNFFLWGTDSCDRTATNSNTSQHGGTFANTSTNFTDINNTTSNDVMCNCHQPAKLLTVQKEGPNKGRKFYGCPKGFQSTCKFFQWADEGHSQNNIGNMSWQNVPTSSRDNSGRSRGQKRANTSNRNSRAVGGKRKCGICGTEGHTRKTCPQNVLD